MVQSTGVKSGDKWRDSDGSILQVILIATDADSGTEVVVYRQQNGTKIMCRRIDKWLPGKTFFERF